jgi:hypothetical protein
MRRSVGLLILGVFLGAAGPGCQVVSALSDYVHREKEKPEPHDAALPVPVAPPTAYCGDLAFLPGRPVHAINLAGCRYVALARGRVDGSSYPLRLRELWRAAGVRRTIKDEPPSPAMLELTEDLVVATERGYWTLSTAWWTLACQSALLEVAGAREHLMQRLLDEGQATRVDLEEARQAHLEARADLALALAGGGDQPGLCEAEHQLRTILGLSESPGPPACGCPLLLPADCPVIEGPLPSCEVLMEQARQNRLDLQEARAKVQVGRRRCQRARKEEKQIEARRDLEVAQAAMDDLCDKVRLELQYASERVRCAREMYGLALQARRAAARTVKAREDAVTAKGDSKLTVLQARRRLLEAIRAERRAAGACALALLELEQKAGVILVRSCIQMPTPPKVNTPRAVALVPAPVLLPPSLPAQTPLLPRTEQLTAREGLCLLDWLAGLARLLPSAPVPSPH